METFLQDLRYGIRMLLKKPVFTAVAVIALALGIGANSAIFSVINAVLLRALPYKDPDHIIRISAYNEQRGIRDGAFSYTRYLHMREQSRLFEDLAVFMREGLTLTGREEPEQIQVARVSASLFPVLGVNPQIGRTFLEEEDKPGGNQVVVVSHRLWQSRFASDPELIGKPLTLDGSSYTVIGIMPKDFHFPDDDVDLWVAKVFETSRFTPEQIRNGAGFLIGLGRLKKGVELRQARLEMDTISHNYQQQNSGLTDADPNAGIRFLPLRDQIVQEIRPALMVLFGAVGFVLLIACANVANLLLARAATRQREMAIRTALGAGRWRIVRQLLTESLLLSLLGGTLGLLLASWSVDLIVAASPDIIPRAREINIDRNVLGFSLLVSLLTGIFFGLAPAIKLSNPNLNETLKEGGRSAGEGSGSRNRIRSLLVVSEVALSLVLLIGAGLLIQSFFRLQRVQTGFSTEKLLTMRITLPQTKYPEGRQKTEFFNQALQKIEALPGVEGAGMSLLIPPYSNVLAPFQVDGRPPLPPGERPLATWAAISPGYFKAMKIPLLKGRTFSEQDLENTKPVAIINETMARTIWPGEDPIGKRMLVGRLPNPSEIVGIVGDVKNAGLDAQPRAQIYTPYPQRPWPSMSIFVRTTGDPLSMAAAIRSQILTVDKDQPISNIRTMEQVMAEAVSQPRLITYLLGIFAALAMLLATIGIYAVIAYTVTQRTHEIGIRMALGAQRRDVLKLIVGQGMKLSLIGVGTGLLISFALTRFLSSLLFEVSAKDPTTFITISVLLSIVALFASYIPARKATMVDPMVALRNE